MINSCLCTSYFSTKFPLPDNHHHFLQILSCCLSLCSPSGWKKCHQHLLQNGYRLHGQFHPLTLNPITKISFKIMLPALQPYTCQKVHTVKVHVSNYRSSYYSLVSIFIKSSFAYIMTDCGVTMWCRGQDMYGIISLVHHSPNWHCTTSCFITKKDTFWPLRQYHTRMCSKTCIS